MYTNTFNKFIKVGNEGDETFLAFAKSCLLKVYPCGRRRARKMAGSDTSDAVKNFYPFDPEARLNTELNNRKTSALNGFADSYIKGIENIAGIWVLSFVIGHYSFELELGDAESVDALMSSLGAEFTKACFGAGITTDTVYVNIKLEEQLLIQGDLLQSKTWVLKGQGPTVSPEADLDILNSASEGSASKNYYYQNYYFAGLSFSNKPLTNADNTEVASKVFTSNSDKNELIFSLALLKADTGNNTWTLTERAKLPKIQHGETPDSIYVQALEADTILWKDSNGENKPVVTLDVVDQHDGTYQLSFASAVANS